MTHYPNIEKAFQFKITKSGNKYCVDTCLPGMPIVGTGKIKSEAKYNLCINWLYMIANYNGNTGGDSAYVPMILDILRKDMQDVGKVIE